MDISILNTELTFGDFVLLSILLMLMHAVTVLAATLSPTAAGSRLINLKAAVTWSFLGVLATIGVGAIADSLSGDLPLLAIPLSFIFIWARFQILTNKHIDLQIVTKQIDDAYLKAILDILPAGREKALLAREVREQAIANHSYFTYLAAGGVLTNAVAPVALGKMIDHLLPSQDKTDTLLKDLEQAGRITRDDGRYFLASAVAVPAEQKRLRA